MPPSGSRAPRLVVINGPAGVGKSALALRWLDGVLDQFPDGALHAVLTESTGRPVAVDDVLGAFLRALGVAPDDVPTTMSERVGLFRTVTSGRSIVLLLDDALSAAQVRALLPASGTSLVVVTSRPPLVGLLAEGAVMMTVEPLAPSAALDLLSHHVGPERLAAERAAGERLVHHCEGLPIALTVAAALIALRPRRSLADLVAAMDNERHRLNVLTIDEATSVRATFDLSYRSLPTSATRVYQVVGVSPGVQMSGELLTSVGGREHAIDGIEMLVDMGVLDEVAPRRYRCHQLVQAHARSVVRQELSAEDRTSMELTVLEWHLFVTRAASDIVMPARPAFPLELDRTYDLPAEIVDHGGALSWLERHRLDLAAMVRLAVSSGRYEIAYQLVHAMQSLFILHKHHREAVEVNKLGLDAAVRSRNWKAEMSMRKRLARVHAQLNEGGAAQQHIDAMLTGARQRNDQRAVASGLKTLGRLHHRRGEYEQAVAALEETVHIIRTVGEQRSLALALIDLSGSLLAVHQYPVAITHLTDATAILRSLHRPDPYNTARATRVLAQAHLLEGDPDTARHLLDEALALLEPIGANHELANTHEALAEVHALLGETEKAWSHRDRANRLTRPGS